MAPKLNFFNKSNAPTSKVGGNSQTSLSPSHAKLNSSSPTPILTEKIKLGLNVATAMHINRGDLIATINGPDSGLILKALGLPPTPEIKSALTKIVEANYTQINNLAVRDFNRPDLKSLAYEVSNAQALKANDVKTLSKELSSVLEGGDNYTKLTKVYRDYAPRVSKTPISSQSEKTASTSAFPPVPPSTPSSTPPKQDAKNEKDSKETTKKSSGYPTSDTSANKEGGKKVQKNERPSSDEQRSTTSNANDSRSIPPQPITPPSTQITTTPTPITPPSTQITTAPTPATPNQSSPTQPPGPSSSPQKLFRQQIRQHLNPKFTNAKATAKNAINTAGRTAKQTARSLSKGAANVGKNIGSGAKTAGRGLANAGRTASKGLGTAGKAAGQGLASAGRAAAQAGKAGAQAAAQASKMLAQLAGRLGTMIVSNPYVAITIIIIAIIIALIVIIFGGSSSQSPTGNQAPISSYELSSCLPTMKKTATPIHVEHPITDSSSDKTVTYKFEITTQGDAKIISCQDTLSIQCSSEEKSQCPTISDPHAIQDEVCSKIQAASGPINIEAKYDLPNGNNYTLINTLTLQVECTDCDRGGSSGGGGVCDKSGGSGKMCNLNQESINAICSYTDWDRDTMFAIACAESSGNCQVYNNICCYGLFQIHKVHAGTYGTIDDFKNCTKNTYAAHEIFKRQGLKAWEVTTIDPSNSAHCTHKYEKGTTERLCGGNPNPSPTTPPSTSPTPPESSPSGTSSSCNGEKKTETLTASAMTCIGEEKNCSCGPMPLPGVPPAPAPQGMGTVIAAKEGYAITSFNQARPESYGSTSCLINGFDVCARGCGPSATTLVSESFNGKLCHLEYLTRAIEAGKIKTAWGITQVCAGARALGLNNCAQENQGQTQQQLNQKIIQFLDSGAMIVAITGSNGGDSPFCNTKTLNSGGGHWIVLVRHEVINGQDYILVAESGSPAKRVGLHPINTVTCDMRAGGTMAIISR